MQQAMEAVATEVVGGIVVCNKRWRLLQQRLLAGLWYATSDGSCCNRGCWRDCGMQQAMEAVATEVVGGIVVCNKRWRLLQQRLLAGLWYATSDGGCCNRGCWRDCGMQQAMEAVATEVVGGIVVCNKRCRLLQQRLLAGLWYATSDGGCCNRGCWRDCGMQQAMEAVATEVVGGIVVCNKRWRLLQQRLLAGLWYATSDGGCCNRGCWRDCGMQQAMEAVATEVVGGIVVCNKRWRLLQQRLLAGLWYATSDGGCCNRGCWRDCGMQQAMEAIATEVVGGIVVCNKRWRLLQQRLLAGLWYATSDGGCCNRGCWRDCGMQQAMEAVNSTKMYYRQAAKQYSVSKTTLCRKAKKSLLNLGTNNTKKNMGRFRNVLSVAQEEELKKRIKGMDDDFYGLTTRDICSLVFEFC